MSSLNSLGLDAFYALAREGNFTRTAKQLGLTQSALSQRVKNLEEELETSLFVRDRTGAQLTEAGQRLLVYCRQKQALEDEYRGGGKDVAALTGVIRIGGYSSVMRSRILPAISELVAKHPELQLEIQTRELRELPTLLLNGAVDYLVLDYVWQREGVRSERVGHEQSVLIEKRGYAGANIILDHDVEDRATSDFLRTTRQSERYRGYRRRYVDDVYGLIDGVRLGLGRAVVPAHLVEGERGLRVLNPKLRVENPICLHYFEQPYYTELQKAVLACFMGK
ncbi:MAG: LysR family transcriptional regulator [Bacteriovoracia bacterium]